MLGSYCIRVDTHQCVRGYNISADYFYDVVITRCNLSMSFRIRPMLDPLFPIFVTFWRRGSGKSMWNHHTDFTGE